MTHFIPSDRMYSLCSQFVYHLELFSIYLYRKCFSFWIYIYIFWRVHVVEIKIPFLCALLRLWLKIHTLVYILAAKLSVPIISIWKATQFDCTETINTTKYGNKMLHRKLAQKMRRIFWKNANIFHKISVIDPNYVERTQQMKRTRGGKKSEAIQSNRFVYRLKLFYVYTL